MRIVFIASMSGYPWGGSEELWSGTALRLAEAGNEVGACVQHLAIAHPKHAQLFEAGIDVHFRKPVLPTLWQRGVRRLFRKPVENPMWRQAVEWLTHQNPDLVCISQGGFSDGVEWMLLCRKMSLPYVVVAHANAESWWPHDQAGAELSFAYESARQSFFVAKRNLELLETQTGSKLHNARVVRNPFNVRYDVSASWPVQTPDWRLACVGRLEPAAKGQDLLFQVLAQPKWRQRNLKVSLFGSGPCEKNLRRLVGLLELTNVEFRGQVEDIERLWREHHGLVLPSRLEGLPISLVEAMLCSRMGIVTDVAGNTEIMEDDVTGFVAAAPTVVLFDQALERAWERRLEWRQMGLAARRSEENTSELQS